MKYQDYIKDYDVVYENHPGRRRPVPHRIYIGTYYRFSEPRERVRFLRWLYSVGLGVIALCLIVPMFMDCVFTRIWYIQVPSVAVCIPLYLSLGSMYRIWRAGEKVTREHSYLITQRMNGCMVAMILLYTISASGCVYGLMFGDACIADWVVSICSLIGLAVSIVLFMQRSGLKMVPVEEN